MLSYQKVVQAFLPKIEQLDITQIKSFYPQIEDITLIQVFKDVIQ